MLKMGGIVCDVCRVVMITSHGNKWAPYIDTKDGKITAKETDELITRRSKKGKLLHFCSFVCETTYRRQVGIKV